MSLKQEEPASMYDWFISLPLVFQCAICILLCPLALALLGLLICFADPDSAFSTDSQTSFADLVRWGALGALIFGMAFGMFQIFGRLLHLPYILAVVLSVFSAIALFFTYATWRFDHPDRETREDHRNE
jgi:hypothetical protein